jgi:hypothetical protein
MLGRETFRLVRAPRANLRTLETLFAASREARYVAFQYGRRLSLVLRRLLFGLRVNSNRIARREGLFERFVELFVQGHRRFLASTFDFRVDATSFVTLRSIREPAEFRYCSGVVCMQSRLLEAEIATFITQIENRGIDDIQIDVTDLPDGAIDRGVREAGDARPRHRA